MQVAESLFKLHIAAYLPSRTVSSLRAGVRLTVT